MYLNNIYIHHLSVKRSLFGSVIGITVLLGEFYNMGVKFWVHGPIHVYIKLDVFTLAGFVWNILLTNVNLFSPVVDVASWNDSCLFWRTGILATPSLVLFCEDYYVC